MTRRKNESSHPQAVATPTAADDDSLNLSRKVDELSCEVERQRNIINLLTQRLSFMQSMFGIEDGVLQNGFASPPTQSGNDKQDFDMSASHAHADTVTADPDGAVYSADRATRNPSPKDSFRSAVLSAVYSERHTSDTRAKNFVVSGLPVNSDVDDKTAVEQLCQTEMNIRPNIRSCRRLGKRVEGKVQSVLVSVYTVDEASSVISNAKQLRKSNDSLVKGQVFINADLTKAQSAAAYELRCQRRKKLQDRMNQTAHADSAIQCSNMYTAQHTVSSDKTSSVKSEEATSATVAGQTITSNQTV